MGREIVSFINRQINTKESVEILDVYKLLYQSCYLTNHLVGAKAKDYLTSEIDKIISLDSIELLYEYISECAIRVNLIPYKNICLKDDKNLDYLFNAFLKSSMEKTNKNIYEEFKYIKDSNFVDNRVMQKMIDINEKWGFLPHHSNIYKEKNNCYYRVIHEKYLSVEMRVKKLQTFIDSINSTKRVIIAGEGRCGSGKTTITSKLNNVTVINVDTFFSENKEERLNFSLLTDVLKKIKDPSNNTIEYDSYCCRENRRVHKLVKLNNVVIIEGVYSYDAKVRSLYDKLVFFVSSKETQQKRLFERENEYYYNKYMNNWIPREEEYFDKNDYIISADILI